MRHSHPKVYELVRLLETNRDILPQPEKADPFAWTVTKDIESDIMWADHNPSPENLAVVIADIRYIQEAKKKCSPS